MASEYRTKDFSQRSWHQAITGLVCSVLAITAVMFATAGWITLSGAYPDHAREFSVPLTGVTVRAGTIEEHNGSLQLVPDRRGVVVVLFEDASWFLAKQLSDVRMTTSGGSRIQRAEWLWQSSSEEKTQAEPLELYGDTLRASLGGYEHWQGRINGIGIALVSTSPITINDISLNPPPPSMGYLLGRMWTEWTFLEGYHGYTINGLKGAGSATLMPMPLAAGMALLLSLAAIALAHVLALPIQIRPSGSILASAIVIWLLVTIPWMRQLWTEAAWAVEVYAGKSEAERRLLESDSRLYSIASWVKKQIPPPPQRLFVVSSAPDPKGTTNFERTKIHYYLAPHNVLSKFADLPSLNSDTVRPGDFALILDSDDESYNATDGKIEPGYQAIMLGEHRGSRLYRIVGRIDD